MRGGRSHPCAWLFALALAALCPPSTARAQGAPPADSAAPAPSDTATATPPPESATEPDDELARKHFEDGKAAADRGDWAAAYTSYRAGLAVQEHFTLLAALGDTATHLGKYRDAAEYSALYLQKAPAGVAPAARAAVQKIFDEAKTHVGSVTISAPAGSDVFVDHALVGKAPLGRDVYVEPGKCHVEARSGSQVGSLIARVEKGGSASVTVVLGVLAPPEPTASASAGKPLPTGTDSAGPPPGPRREFLIAGAAAVGAAAITGAVLFGLSVPKQSDEAALRDELVKLGKGNVCAPPNRDPRCDKALDTGRAYDTLVNTGAWFLIGAGAAAGATAIYYLVTRTPPSPRVGAAVAVTPAGGGGSLSFRW
jgi:hypothetical protein